MALSYNLGYQDSILVHPTRRQIFAGKPYSTFPNIWEWVICIFNNCIEKNQNKTNFEEGSSSHTIFGLFQSNKGWIRSTKVWQHEYQWSFRYLEVSLPEKSSLVWLCASEAPAPLFFYFFLFFSLCLCHKTFDQYPPFLTILNDSKQLNSSKPLQLDWKHSNTKPPPPPLPPLCFVVIVFG